MIFILGIGVCSNTYAQSICTFSLQGNVTDHDNGKPLEFVNVFIQEVGKGSVTDEKGNYTISDVCDGDYHVIFSHIGCDPVEKFIHIHGSEVLDLAMEHAHLKINEVTISSKRDRFQNQANEEVNQKVIEENLDKSLGILLEKQIGVQAIKTGNSIAKPVVNGLYGNRLTILNNGIPQGGQQWGNDHAPEIDPSVANKITVIKGVSALELPGTNLGSLILVEPAPISNDPHLHGQFGYTYETNGRGHSGNLQLQQNTGAIAWKINGTAKKYGDRHTPDYFLTNTGNEELNLAIQLEKTIKDKTFLKFYGSTFNTEIGVLRGAHIGNTTDLENALLRDEPLFTRDTFSYDINAPRQVVNHHLFKLQAKHFINDDDFIDASIGYQINRRKEFDIRRGGRTSTAALDLFQTTLSTDIKYHKQLANDWSMNIGNQNLIVNNANVPGTGIFPLLPNYTRSRLGVFHTFNKSFEKIAIDIGYRYDYEQQRTAFFTNAVPSVRVNFTNNFHNGSLLFSSLIPLSDKQSLNINTGITSRNPAINELYSNGLHQGVSGIEEGDPDLQPEVSWKSSISYTTQFTEHISFVTQAYYQLVNDYIFLNPQNDFRLTIRGAFPVFVYEQTNARIVGLDVKSEINIGCQFLVDLRYSYIKGDDLSDDKPLVFIPAPSFNGTLTYQFKKDLKTKHTTINGLELSWNHTIVGRQKNLLDDQDFLAPPDGYYLMGARISANIILPKFKFRVFVNGDNLFNTSYRSYLNRLRYYADEGGRSVVFGINTKF